jgi:membrane protease YdiL (CAAX protease family)
MALVSDILTLLLAAYTVLVEPFLRTNFYRNLKKSLATDPHARLLYYRTQLLWEWSWVVLIIIIFIPRPQPLLQLGLIVPGLLGWVIMAALLLGVALSTWLIRRNPRLLQNMQHSLEPSAPLLPSNPQERKWFALTAITAGICEELLYRGFLLNFLALTFPGLDFLLASIISGIVYGLSRAYLGGRGILQNSLNGFSFAVVFFLSGNLISAVNSNQPVGIVGCLIPAMVFHALAELRTMFLWQPGPQVKKAK